MAIIILIIKILIFSIKNTLKDEHLIQVNLNILIILKLIYKTFYYHLIYIRPDRILKTTKDIGILINKAEILKYHYKLYTLSKSIYIISYILLTLTTRCFIKIYIDTIKYKPLLTNGHKCTIHLLDYYFNY